MFLQWRRYATGALCAIAMSVASTFLMATEPETQPQSQAAPTNWQEIAMGKTLVVATDLMIKSHMLFSAKEGGFEWEGNEALSQIGDQATRDAGFAARNKARFLVSEEFFGDAEELRQRMSARGIQPGRLSLWHVRDVPYGAKKVLRLRVFDAVVKQQPQELVVIAFDDLPVDVMRRVGLEDGVLPMIQMAGTQPLSRRGGIPMAGSVPNQVKVNSAVVADIEETSMQLGKMTELGSNVGSIGAQISSGVGGGVTGMVIAAAASLFVENALSTATIYRVTYQIEGETAPRQSYQGRWAHDMKAGDHITVRTGSFSERVTRSDDQGS